MNIKRIVFNTLYDPSFSGTKTDLICKIQSIVDSITVDDLIQRWNEGEEEYGPLREETLLSMNIKKELKEEILDSFWYHVMENVAESIKSKGKREQ